MSKHPYTYTILRYVHDTSTGEFANVGVVLSSPEAHYANAILRPTYGRLSKMFPGFDAALAVLAGPSALGAGEALFVRPDAGQLAGMKFLVVDANGVAGYQAGADYVINVVTQRLGAQLYADGVRHVLEEPAVTMPIGRHRSPDSHS